MHGFSQLMRTSESQIDGEIAISEELNKWRVEVNGVGGKSL